VTWSKFHADDPQTFGNTKKFNHWATWHLGFAHPWPLGLVFKMVDSQFNPRNNLWQDALTFCFVSVQEISGYCFRCLLVVPNKHRSWNIQTLQWLNYTALPLLIGRVEYNSPVVME
jgi:hypothetical protein